jgi:hypothetical protein
MYLNSQMYAALSANIKILPLLESVQRWKETLVLDGDAYNVGQ